MIVKGLFSGLLGPLYPGKIVSYYDPNSQSYNVNGIVLTKKEMDDKMAHISMKEHLSQAALYQSQQTNQMMNQLVNQGFAGGQLGSIGNQLQGLGQGVAAPNQYKEKYVEEAMMKLLPPKFVKKELTVFQWLDSEVDKYRFKL